jgi:SAM-dependent methyltransferase
MADYSYAGSELDLFAAAVNWKSYHRRLIAPYYGAEVLEVGAGIGGTTRVFFDHSVRRWVCLEPDPGLASSITTAVAEGALPPACEVAVGTLDALPADARFDTVLYIDVLEHIEDDTAEMARAARVLKPGGYVVVLSPAHQFLFTPFDAALGHFRRYSRSTLRASAPPDLALARLSYLDAAGMLLSLGNRLVLKSATPTRRQIAFWDGVVVPSSRLLDPLLGFRVGKSVLGVWQKPVVADQG